MRRMDKIIWFISALSVWSEPLFRWSISKCLTENKLLEKLETNRFKIKIMNCHYFFFYFRASGYYSIQSFKSLSFMVSEWAPPIWVKIAIMKHYWHEMCGINLFILFSNKFNEIKFKNSNIEIIFSYTTVHVIGKVINI